MAARTEKIVGFTVTRTGKKYTPDEIPRDIKDAIVEVEVSEINDIGVSHVLGTYETQGWSEDGSVYHIVPDDLAEQVVASQAGEKPAEGTPKAKAETAK